MKTQLKNQEKIAIIAPANLKYVPYVQNYIRILKNSGAHFCVLSWDKMNMEEENVDFAYHFPLDDSNRKKMFLGYLSFAQKCRSYIKHNQISKLIILTAAPAFFLGFHFLKRFSGKYILDIRDESPLVRKFPKAFAKICKMAKQIVVSSNKFNAWIPAKTLLCHNADALQIEQDINMPVKQGYKEPLSIAYAGMMIEGKINIEMLKHMGKDSRFAFWFIGRPNNQTEEIKQFVETEGLVNVSFQGTYNKEDIYDIYREKADLVNIIRAKTIINRNALPNKLYDAVLAGVPVVVFDHNEAIAEYVTKYHLGLVVEENMEMLADTIAELLKRFDYTVYEKGRKEFLQAVVNDLALFEQAVLEFGASVLKA